MRAKVFERRVDDAVGEVVGGFAGFMMGAKFGGSGGYVVGGPYGSLIGAAFFGLHGSFYGPEAGKALMQKLKEPPRLPQDPGYNEPPFLFPGVINPNYRGGA